MKKQGKLLIFSGSILAFLAFMLPFGVFAEPWTDPTCDPPNCNTEGPIWVNPDTAQNGYIDLSYTNGDSTPVLQITDTRTSGSPEASLYINSAVNDKPAIYAFSTGSGAAYGASFRSDSNAALYLAGGLKFAGLSTLNEPSYVTVGEGGVLYYNTSSNLFKFYNGSQWVELSNQWSSNGNEIYRSFASAATSQGVAIKSGDSSDPNDNYNLDVVRKSLSTNDRAVNGYLEAVSNTSYASGALGAYDSSGNMVGVKGNSTATGAITNYGGYFTAAGDTGVGVYGEANSTVAGAVTNYGGYFVSNSGKGYGVYAIANSTDDYSATGGYFESSATRGRGVEGRVTDTSSTYTKYGGYFRADGATDAGVYAWATSGDASNYHYGLWGHADNTNGIGIYAYGTAYSGYFTDAPVVITDDGGPGGAVFVAGNTYATSDGELYVEGDIESDANIYANMFYDNDATIYYMDPSSTVSGRLYGNMQIGYGLNSDNDYLYFDQNTESLMWDNASSRFELSDDFYARGNAYSDANLYLNYDQTDTYVNILFGTVGSTAAEYIQYSPSLDRFTISGDVYARTVLLSSDKRLKKNITEIDSALKIVSDLRPVSFDWKENDKSDYGFIAQEMYEVLPELVDKPEDDNGTWGIEYANLTAVLTAAMQEQQGEIEKQAAEISELRQELEALKDLLK